MFFLHVSIIKKNYFKFSVGCGQQDVPGIYVKVSHFNQWIQTQLLRNNWKKTHRLILVFARFDAEFILYYILLVYLLLQK